MSDNAQERAEQIFLEALELPSAQRVPFVDKQCGDNANLRSLVESFLAADAAADDANFLESHFLAGATSPHISRSRILPVQRMPRQKRSLRRKTIAFAFCLDTSRGGLGRS